ncbi:MAG: hypothetical protein WD037_08310 [Balneolales bacterium]
MNGKIVTNSLHKIIYEEKAQDLFPISPVNVDTGKAWLTLSRRIGIEPGNLSNVKLKDHGNSKSYYRNFLFMASLITLITSFLVQHDVTKNNLVENDQVTSSDGMKAFLDEVVLNSASLLHPDKSKYKPKQEV